MYCTIEELAEHFAGQGSILSHNIELFIRSLFDTIKQVGMWGNYNRGSIVLIVSLFERHVMVCGYVKREYNEL